MPEADSTVTYRPCPGHDGYRVGSDGSVWTSLYRSGVGSTGRGSGVVPGGPWRQLRPGTQPSGSRYVSIRCTSYLVHRLVLEAFIGPCPEGMECCHFPDPNPSNNALSNIRWDTPKANNADQVAHGTRVQGERHPGATITEDIVRSIRADDAAGMPRRANAKKHGVGTNQVSRIVLRTRWAHVV